MLTRFPSLAAALSLLFVGCPSAAVRDHEISECRPGEVSTWSDGADRPIRAASLRFAYRHSGAPSWFTQADVEARIEKATQAWSQCGIHASLVDGDSTTGREVILIQWDEAASMGNFGLANHPERTLSLGPKAFVLLNTSNPRHDPRSTLQLVISHEIGHFYGLQAHSRRCVDVLSYYTLRGETCFTRNPAGIVGEREYRSELPTACDIERCRAINSRPKP